MAALPGNHYCLAHQGNHSHYADHNCDLCKVEAHIAALEAENKRLKTACDSYSEAEILRGDEKQAAVLTERETWVIAKQHEPTEAMLTAARDWSAAKYGKPIGNDAAKGCWQAMHSAAPATSPVAAQEQKPT